MLEEKENIRKRPYCRCKNWECDMYSVSFFGITKLSKCLFRLEIPYRIESLTKNGLVSNIGFVLDMSLFQINIHFRTFNANNLKIK